MRSSKKLKKPQILVDPKHSSVLVSKLINQVLRAGKKSKAQSIVYRAFDIIEQKTKKKGLDVFEEAIRNVSPPLEVRPKRIGGANYQIPMEVPRDRKLTLALRWIVNVARDKQGKPMEEFLAAEIIDAAGKVGSVMKKREDLIKMAEANRAFAHYARM